MLRSSLLKTSSPLSLRRLATATTSSTDGGSIKDAFASLSGLSSDLPSRFADLKKELWHPVLEERWREILAELEVETERIVQRKKAGEEIVPRLPFQQIRDGKVDPELRKRMIETGTVIVEGAVEEETALQWKADIRAYAERNKEHVRGYPDTDIQVFEFYNTHAQTSARTHPNAIATQKYLLSQVCYTSDPTSTRVSLRTPISYYDRLRMRTPGDATFALGPHIDGGSLERWEDPGYRSCFSEILSRTSKGWKEHDPYDVTPRVQATMNLYNEMKTGACSVLRPWQGWTSLSHTGPSEGTLLVFPRVTLSNAYVMLRPFFGLKSSAPRDSLAAEDWEVDLESTTFPGSAMGRGQELNDETHPHLRLSETMTPMPRVKPGDQVFWFSDVIHAVEKTHAGKGDSSVLYIPAVPLTDQNAAYLRLQKTSFAAGKPAPDFPQGRGESLNDGRATPEEVVGIEARRMLGLEAFEVPEGAGRGEREVVEGWNAEMRRP